MSDESLEAQSRRHLIAAEQYHAVNQELRAEIEQLTYQRDKALADAAMWEELANEYKGELDE